MSLCVVRPIIIITTTIILLILITITRAGVVSEPGPSCLLFLLYIDDVMQTGYDISVSLRAGWKWRRVLAGTAPGGE